MQISIILANPGPDSFNHRIAATAREDLLSRGHRVILHDLYAEEFNPILPGSEIPRNAYVPPLVEQHCREIAEAEGIVIVHPNWWGMPPAILKGWVDRVIRPGVAYEFLEGDSGEGVPRGLLKARAAVIFNTANTSAERETNIFGDPLETIWKNCILDLCGVKIMYREIFRIIVTSTEEQRQGWLLQVRMMLQGAFPNA